MRDITQALRTGRPVIAVTAGDPAGIGPEIIARFFAGFQPSRSKALVIGSPESIRPWSERFGWSCPIIRSLEEMGDVEESVSFDSYILDTGCRSQVPPGGVSREGGKHAGQAIEVACKLAGEGSVQAIVTAPISKQAMNMAGYRYSGHTEMLASRFKSPDCQMMMAYRAFRVVPATRHIPVSDIAKHLTVDGLLKCLEVVNRALVELFRLKNPSIAVASLNPHAGEEGIFGEEEIELIQPALRRAQEQSIQAEGPFAADSLFQSPLEGRYDAYVTMYHDQGLIPFKMVAKRRGVNVTIGLPVVRTSVDHGAAFDIAGKGEADPSSIAAAYRLAERLVRGTKRSGKAEGAPWKSEAS